MGGTARLKRGGLLEHLPIQNVTGTMGGVFQDSIQ